LFGFSCGHSRLYCSIHSSVTSRTSVTVPDTGWEIVAIADFDNDDDSDLLWRHATSGQNVIWVMDGTSLDSYAWLDTVADTNWEIK